MTCVLAHKTAGHQSLANFIADWSDLRRFVFHHIAGVISIIIILSGPLSHHPKLASLSFKYSGIDCHSNWRANCLRKREIVTQTIFSCQQFRNGGAVYYLMCNLHHVHYRISEFRSISKRFILPTLYLHSQ